jgi:hypothetical protein
MSAPKDELDESSSIEELRVKVGDSTGVQLHVTMYVRDARSAIERGGRVQPAGWLANGALH